MATIIPRPPRQTGEGQRDAFELTKWFDAVWRALSGIVTGIGSGAGVIAWGAINFVGSTLESIETRTHNLLQDIEQTNDTDTSTVGGKHTSNAQLKKYEDHRASTGNPHSTAHSNLSTIAQADDTSTNTDGGKHVTDALVKKYEDHRTASTDVHGVGSGSAVVGTTTTQTLTNKKFGGSTDYAEFESDGTLHFVGGATTFIDLQGSALTLKTQGSGVSVNVTNNTIDFTTGADLNDYVYANFQMQHSWKMGSDVFFHIHWEQAETNMPNFLSEVSVADPGSRQDNRMDVSRCYCQRRFMDDRDTQPDNPRRAITPPTGAALSDVIEVQVLSGYR